MAACLQRLNISKQLFPQNVIFFIPKTCLWKCLQVAALSLLLAFLFAWPAQAQLPFSNATATTTPPEAPKDTLGRETPRRTVLGFLNAARKGDYEVASNYLDTHLRDKAAAELARQLYVVLDRRLPPRLNELSDSPEGSLANPLKPNQDVVGTIALSNGKVEIWLERVEQEKLGKIWLFSGATLEAIPGAYDEIDVVPIENLMPHFLVKTRLLRIPLFELLAVFVGLPLCYFFTLLLDRLISPLAGMARRLLRRQPDLPNPRFLSTPVRLLLLAFAIHWALSEVGLPLMARYFWYTTAAVITTAACVWIAILFCSWGERKIQQRLERRNLTGATSVLRLSRRIADGLIIFAGILVVLRYFGVNPTAALAGLGVGGIAVALAAQKTLENVIGGISVIFDQPVRVGDFLKFGEKTTGTVESIGLRSTRIRTLDRTVISVPNGQLAAMSLENYSVRDKFWLHPILGLRYETTSAQIRTITGHLRKMLEAQPLVDPNSVRVRFIRMGSFSLDVEVCAYVNARDWSHFLEVQEGLLLEMMRIVESAGAQLAFPSQTMYLASDSIAPENGLPASSKTHPADRKNG